MLVRWRCCKSDIQAAENGRKKVNYYVAITCLQSFNVYKKIAGGEPVSCSYNLSPILSSVNEYINTKPRWFCNQLQTHKIFIAMMIWPTQTLVGRNCMGELPVQSASEWSRGFLDPQLGRDLWCHQMLSSCK